MTQKLSLNSMETEVESPTRPTYKVYKRRFWGLAQLVLLNIVVSWDVRAQTFLYFPPYHTDFSSGSPFLPYRLPRRSTLVSLKMLSTG